MTTLRDILFDLVKDTQLDLIRLNEEKESEVLTDDELNDKVDEYIELIKNRLVG
jgi:hypothetical protein